MSIKNKSAVVAPPDANVKSNVLKNAHAAVDRSLDSRRDALNQILLTIMPEASMVARARRIGISRQTLYDWMQGKSYPNKVKAKRLSQLTGIPAEVFRP
jgi:DNA-binding transcriptional regulator YiaG